MQAATTGSQDFSLAPRHLYLSATSANLLQSITVLHCVARSKGKIVEAVRPVAPLQRVGDRNTLTRAEADRSILRQAKEDTMAQAIMVILKADHERTLFQHARAETADHR
jgi:hypothetical protein